MREWTIIQFWIYLNVSSTFSFISVHREVRRGQFEEKTVCSLLMAAFERLKGLSRQCGPADS